MYDAGRNFLPKIFKLIFLFLTTDSKNCILFLLNNVDYFNFVKKFFPASYPPFQDPPRACVHCAPSEQKIWCNIKIYITAGILCNWWWKYNNLSRYLDIFKSNNLRETHIKMFFFTSSKNKLLFTVSMFLLKFKLWRSAKFAYFWEIK